MAGDPIGTDPFSDPMDPLPWKTVLESVVDTEPLVLVGSDGQPCLLCSSGVPQKILVLDSSFNPPTRGHEKLLAVSESAVGPVDLKILMLAKSNADKAVAGAQLHERLAMMRLMASACDEGDGSTSRTIISVTVFGLFVDKARPLLQRLGESADAPISTIYFIVGSDTLVRIFNPKYYSNPEQELSELFRMVHLIACDRDEESDEQMRLAMTTELFQKFKDRITLVRMDDPEAQAISSTQVRKSHQQGEDVSPLVLPGIGMFLARHENLYQ